MTFDNLSTTLIYVDQNKTKNKKSDVVSQTSWIQNNDKRKTSNERMMITMMCYEIAHER